MIASALDGKMSPAEAVAWAEDEMRRVAAAAATAVAADR